jgi:hypothetical protein
MRCLFSVLFAHVLRWGSDGHRIITDVALSLVSYETRRWVQNQLDDEIDIASVWADSPEASSLYPGSSFYHFSNTLYPTCGPFIFERDCGFGPTKGLCIVSGLTEAIARVKDIDAPRNERTGALKFVLHLMADIHQPLHTGFRVDSGGLRIRLLSPEGRDLHYLWTQLVQGHGEKEQLC